MDTTDLMNVLKKFKLVTDDLPCGASQEDVAEGPPDLVSLQKDAKGPLEGFLIFYVNVGQMPACNVEKYLRRTMESYKKVIERIPEKYAALWIPCRVRETAVEVVHF
jgi:hypothetical protein